MMRSHLARHQPTAPADDLDIDRMRRAAWHQRGWICLKPDDVADDWVRQALINLATKLFGKRT